MGPCVSKCGFCISGVLTLPFFAIIHFWDADCWVVIICQCGLAKRQRTISDCSSQPQAEWHELRETLFAHSLKSMADVSDRIEWMTMRAHVRQLNR